MISKITNCEYCRREVREELMYSIPKKKYKVCGWCKNKTLKITNDGYYRIPKKNNKKRITKSS